jgi:hypothetical protein
LVTAVFGEWNYVFYFNLFFDLSLFCIVESFGVRAVLTSLLNIVTAKQRPSLDAQKTRAIYKKR